MIKRLKNKLNDDIHLKELLNASAISFVLRILGIALGYIFVIFVTRAYGVEAMGIFALAFTVLQIASVISSLGMDTLILRFTSEYTSKNNAKKMIKETYKKILFLTLSFSILISFLLYMSGSFIAEFIFNKPELSNAFELISLGVLPMTMLTIHREVLRGLKKIMFFSFFTSVSVSFFASISILILVYLSANILIPLYAQIIAITISAVLAFIILKHSIELIEFVDKKDYLYNDRIISLKEMLFIAFPMMFASSLFMIMNWTDTIILGIFKGSEEVGIYSVALKVSMLTSIILMAINSISAPKFAEMWGKGDLIGLEKIVKQSTKFIFFSSLPLIILILLFPAWILGFFGEKFEIGATVLILLTIGQFFNAISGSVGTLLSMTGHQVIVQNILIFTILINIALNLLLVKDYGIIGVAIATMVSTIFWNGLMNFFIWKKLGFLTLSIGIKK